MAERPRLAAAPREVGRKAMLTALRRAEKIPGVVYGHAREPQPLALNAHDVERLLERVNAESTVIELLVDGRTARTLIREIQRHPFRREILHVDFQELVAGEKVTVNVPLVLVGTAEGVRAGGILDQVLRELEIEVDPSNIPERFDADVSALTIGHSLHVRDVPLPAGVTVLDDEDATISVIIPPRAETPAAGVETVAEPAAEPELIRKTKEEGEEEGES
jgi:large subunit ribosomal protein L25